MHLLQGQSVRRRLGFRQAAKDAQGQFVLTRGEVTAPKDLFHVGQETVAVFLWGLDAHRIGIIGFSAGGHLASTAATHFDTGNASATDPIDRVSSRPDVAILVYPVITFTDPYTHGGSRHNLLGDNPAPDLITLLSNEKQVTAQTPPCFLVHGSDDTVVPVENSLMFAMACHKAGVPFEIHVYEHGPHGFGLGGADPVLGAWPGACAKWLEHRGFLKKS